MAQCLSSVAFAKNTTCAEWLTSPTLSEVQAHTVVEGALRRHVIYQEVTDEVLERFLSALIGELDPEPVYLTSKDLQAIKETALKNLESLRKEVQFIELGPGEISVIDFIRQSIQQRLKERYLQLPSIAQEDMVRKRQVYRSILVRSENLTPEKIREIKLTTLMSSLDYHSSFSLPKAPAQPFKFLAGLTMKEVVTGIEIMAVRKDGPADRAGLRIGDILTHISFSDEQKPIALRSRDLEEISTIITSWGGDPDLRFQVVRGNQKFELSMSREWVPSAAPSDNEGLKSMVVEVADRSLGVIWFSEFWGGVAEEIELTVKEMIDNRNIAGLVLDLRGNRGGRTKEALAILNMFIESGPLAMIGQRGSTEKTLEIRTAFPTIFPKVRLPLVVLMDQNSASSSEMVAIGLQDHRRAVILGDRQSFGKGTQQEFHIFEGRRAISESAIPGELKLTTGYIYSPKGRSAQHVGVRPHIVFNEQIDPSNLEVARPTSLPRPKPLLGSDLKPDRGTGVERADIRRLRMRYENRLRKRAFDTAGVDAVSEQQVASDQELDQALFILSDLISIKSSSELDSP